MNSNFLDPEYYLVSYWPGTNPSDNIITVRTESNTNSFKENFKFKYMLSNKLYI